MDHSDDVARALISADVLAYLNDAPTSELNGQNVRIVEAWSGTDNLLWRVRSESTAHDAVLKLYLDAGQARSRRQFAGQQTFAPLGIAPRPLWYDRYPQGLARQVLVYEWVAGHEIDLAQPAHVAALATAVARVHSTELEAVQRLSPNPLNLETLWRILGGSVLHLAAWLPSVSQELASHFQQIAANAEKLVGAALPLWQGALPAPVHGDLKLDNCLMTASSVLLLDWEMFGLGDPALDAATFLYWNRLGLSEEASTVWLKNYLSATSHIHMAERMGVYAQLLPFQTLCYLLDGVHNLAVDDGRDGGAQGELIPMLEFLRETLQTALREAAAALSVEVEEDNPSVNQFVDACATTLL